MENILEPCIAELYCLWEGLRLVTYRFVDGRIVRAWLLCLSCDLPAARKLGGFQNFNGTHGCSHCKKTFPRVPNNAASSSQQAGRGNNNSTSSRADWSGFNDDAANWELRTHEEHFEKAFENRFCQDTIAGATRHLQQHGARWSPFFVLPYWARSSSSTLI